MSIELITFLLVATFVALLVLGLPLAWTMGATAVIFTLGLFEPATMFMTMTRVYHMMLNYALVSVPLFVLMGCILEKSGVAEQLFDAVYVWSGPLRGGLAIGTIVACVVMAAMVGIVGAEIVTFGLIALPQMLDRGYDKSLALGSITSGGGMATLIPPSIVFIVYGMTAGVSIGDLFIAGILPGGVLAVLFIGYIVISVWLRPHLAPAATEEERRIPLKKKLQMLKGLIMPAFIAFAVLGSIYIGIATPTEAAALGCFGALVSAIINRRLSWYVMKEACYETLWVSCMLTWLFFGAQAIIGVYTLAGGAMFVKNTILALPFGPWGIVIVMQIIWVFLGMFLDWIGILLLTGPMFVPIVEALGFNLVWFGVIFCMNMHISYLTPPFGPSVFYMASVAPPGISVTDVYKANLPYLFLTFVGLAIVMIFQELSLWLPSLMSH
ncbi:MAG: TRAP transporter large permease subunit [Deltaproteobacteria bacterium]|nr:TRAP transporter large permease subunit [Deltaproteobacteria bacterium]